MKGLAGALVAGNDHARPRRKPRDEGLHARIGQHGVPGHADQGIGFRRAQQIAPGAVLNPWFTFKQPIDRSIHSLHLASGGRSGQQ